MNAIHETLKGFLFLNLRSVEVPPFAEKLHSSSDKRSNTMLKGT